MLRKYRKANRIVEFIKQNKNIRSIFFDHWKSAEKINTEMISNFPSFCLIHSKEINNPKDTLLNKRVLNSIKKIKYVIANSNFTKNLGVSIGIPKEKIHIINPGCDEPVNIEKEYQDEAESIFKDSFPRILTVSRLDRRKNHQNVLMCIRNLKEKFPNIKYVSVGDGEEKKKLMVLIKELKIQNEVVILDKIHQKLKVALIKKSDLFLSILFFPFINLKNREKIVKQIYKSLNPGGGFILVEKIRSKDSNFEDILNQMYFDFKLRNSPKRTSFIV